jgi:trans-2,3-dihydro-3-hydroxyanthranilate isomerase
MPFFLAEVRDLAALAAARPKPDVMARILPPERATGFHLYARAGQDGIDIRARMFAPLYSVPEDPATGSANVALVGLLAMLERAADARLVRNVAQGVEMARPRLMEAIADKEGVSRFEDVHRRELCTSDAWGA